MEEVDSNAEILPAKKNNKRKQMNQCDKAETKRTRNLSKCTSKKLSNSQKRKLKKLEEEKEKALIYSTSIEMLEKYKLPEDAYSLLRSSTSIGRAETVKEKRRRAIQFSVAGLVVLGEGESFERRAGSDSSVITELQGHDVNDKGQVQLIIPERDISDSMGFSQLPVDPKDCRTICGFDDAMSTAEVPGEFSDLRARNGTISPDTLCHDGGKSFNRMDSVDEGNMLDAKRRNNLSDCPSRKLSVPPCVVHVSRPNEVEEKRKDLPIVMMEQEIMEAINDHPTVIICGETGSGKTTQVPQFLYEAGHGSKQFRSRSGIIGVTQPRRVAVLSTAKRVAFELGLRLGKEVGFQVRYDKKIGENSSIKFMTDGILLREVQNDILLRRYSVIILDEAHERSLNTDILIGMLTRVIQQRQLIYESQQTLLQSGQSISSEDLIFPLKLVLMSATLRVEDFISGRRLFPEPPPVVEVPTRQFPVTTHFAKKTERDYIGQAYKKVMSIHKKLPQGGILVFLTGQREVEYLCRKLRKASKEMITRSTEKGSAASEVSSDDAPETSSFGGVDMKEINEAFDDSPHDQNDGFYYSEGDPSNINDYNDVYDDSYESDEESEWETPDDNCSYKDNLVDGLEEEGNLASLKAAFEALAGKSGLNSKSDAKKDTLVTGTEGSPKEVATVNTSALHVLPLYAMLPAEAQLRVFEEVKEGERLVVVATNVAETSLTIPGIKYVVDTGREKVKTYYRTTGIENYEVQWISQASAAQRAGRAGRTGPGHCYRLYSSAVFNNVFHEFSCPEISKVPVDSVILVLKSMGIDRVVNFPFPTPPGKTALAEAESCLKVLGALNIEGNLTSLGKAMSYYPMSPRHSRMLLTVIQIMGEVKSYHRANLVLGYAVATAAALSLSNPFVIQSEGNNADKNEKKKLKETRRAAREKFSNPSSDALTVAHALQCFELSEGPEHFCEEFGLHLKTMEEMSKLRKQLLHLVFNRNKNSDANLDKWTHGNMQDIENSWQHSSGKNPLSQNEEEVLGQAICAGWADRVAKKERAAKYQACMVKEPVFLHHRSSLYNSAPELLVYCELIGTEKPKMHGATRVKPEWLVKYAESLCYLSPPLIDPKPYYDARKDEVYCWVTASFGPASWELREPVNVPIKNDFSHRVAVFACCLLKGQVLPCLRGVRSLMAAAPETVLNREAMGQPRVGNLLKKFEEMKVDSCARLRQIWDQNPRECYLEIKNWFQDKVCNQFKELWLEMQLEAHLEPKKRFSKRSKREERKF